MSIARSFAFAALAFLAALMPGTALAVDTLPTVELEELTWTELRDQIKSGTTTIIIPIGGTEQSGPQMALGKHNVRARLLAEKIALALGHTLVAPVIAYVPEGSVDPATHHMKFPGTITIPDPVFEKTLEYAARSFKLAGFRDIVLLGDHGGYQKDLTAVAARLNREWAGSKVRVHAIKEYYDAAQTAFAQALGQRGYTVEAIGAHAGLADTSLTLALDPRLVRTERLSAADTTAAGSGVQGDPRQASAELGTIGVDLIVGQSVAAIRRAVAPR